MKYTSLLAFVAGAAIGSATTWYIVKKKYEQIAQEEIESVKAVFTQPKTKPYEGPQSSDEDTQKEQEKKAEANRNKPDISDYAKMLGQEGYTDYSKYHEDTEEDEEEPILEPEKRELQPDAKPYVISPDQFGEFDDYSIISLSYYADHILADDNDEILEDVEDAVGIESLTHFGEYEDDSVFVRNDRLKVDYEILKDLRKYTDVIKSKPYLIKEHE